MTTLSWDTVTPAEPWTIRDTVSHIAFFDEKETEAISDPEAFANEINTGLIDGIDDYIALGLDRGRSMSPAGVLEWWRSARSAELQAFEGVDPDARLPWFGPPMKASSAVVARLMETWAHGHDVAEALGVTRAAHRPALPHRRTRREDILVELRQSWTGGAGREGQGGIAGPGRQHQGMERRDGELDHRPCRRVLPGGRAETKLPRHQPWSSRARWPVAGWRSPRYLPDPRDPDAPPPRRAIARNFEGPGQPDQGTVSSFKKADPPATRPDTKGIQYDTTLKTSTGARVTSGG